MQCTLIPLELDIMQYMFQDNVMMKHMNNYAVQMLKTLLMDMHSSKYSWSNPYMCYVIVLHENIL